MADLSKLKKQAEKTAGAVESRRAALDEAIARFAEATSEHAIANEAVEQAAALETALALRSKKASG